MELNEIIKIRANSQLKQHLNKVAEKQGVTPSQYLRQHIQDAYLNTLQTQTQTV